MKKSKRGQIRTVALLCALMILISSIMAGCGSVEKLKLDIKSSSGDSSSSDNLTWYADPNADNTSETTSSVNNNTSGTTSKVYSSSGSGNLVITTRTSASGSTSNTTTKKSTSSKTTTSAESQDAVDKVYNEFAYQRKLGFNNGYDQMSGFAIMNLCNVDNYFTYGGKDWLIEFWKGEYELVTVGGEIGIYNHTNTTGKTPANPSKLHYNCAENADAMKMSMTLWQCDSDGDRVMVTCPRQTYWWMCGFATGRLKTHRKRSDLVMVATITLPSAGMRDKFITAMESNGFEKGSTSSYKSYDKYSVSGNNVSLVWKYVNADA